MLSSVREKERKERERKPCSHVSISNDTTLALPTAYDRKHFYKITTYRCIHFNERNAKKGYIATGLRSNKNR